MSSTQSKWEKKKDKFVGITSGKYPENYGLSCTFIIFVDFTAMIEIQVFGQVSASYSNSCRNENKAKGQNILKTDSLNNCIYKVNSC